MISTKFKGFRMNKQIHPKLTYTVKEIMELTGIKSRETIISWIRTGKLKASKPGKQYIVRSYDFNDLLEKHMVQAPTI